MLVKSRIATISTRLRLVTQRPVVLIDSQFTRLTTNVNTWVSWLKVKWPQTHMYIRQSKKWQLTVVYFRLLSLNLGLRHKFTQYANICTCQILQSNNIQVLKASKPTYYYGSSSYRPKEVAAQARSTSSSSSSSPPRAYSYATTYGENEKNTNPLISHTVRIRKCL